ncbi:hypothetical protein D3C71_1905230 [compost metagenome]
MLAVQRQRLIDVLAQHLRITGLPVKLLLSKDCQRSILSLSRDAIAITAAGGHQAGDQRCSSTSAPSLKQKRSHGDSLGSNRCVYLYEL